MNMSLYSLKQVNVQTAVNENAVKTWFRLCSVQCARCQCVVWFTFKLGLCSVFGLLFDLGFYTTLGMFPKTWGKTAIHIALCGWS